MKKLVVMSICVFMIFSLISCSSKDESSKDESSKDETSPAYEYVASKNSDKYHKLSCRYVDNIKQQNLVYYEYEYQATNAGKEPCSECKP